MAVVSVRVVKRWFDVWASVMAVAEWMALMGAAFAGARHEV